MRGPISIGEHPAPAPLRVLVFMEATWLSGPAKNLIELARLAGPRVTFAVATFLRGRGPATNPFVASCERAGIGVHPILERGALDPRVLPQMRRLANAFAPDLVQSHSVKSHFLVRISGLAGRYRWIAFHHGYTSTDQKMTVYNRLDRFSLPAADRVVTVCEAFARDLERKGVARERLVVRHNAVRPFSPVDPVSLARVRVTVPAPPESRLLVAVGRLSREKGHVDLIKALASLKSSHPLLTLGLVLVGDGPERGRLVAAAREAGVASQVMFAGHQADVRPFYALADAIVIPSHSEGSPNVLLEAMAAGVPIIATAVGGVPEIVSDGREALLVPSESPAALAAAVARLFDGQGLRRHLSTRALTAAADHSPEAYCQAVLALYTAIVPNSSDATARAAFTAIAPPGC
ncbi:MAG TPA: glycosyltransferase [Terriglobales bacterium]|nr:glycosyltransferase [Terriglobales bacterium]